MFAPLLLYAGVHLFVTGHPSSCEVVSHYGLDLHLLNDEVYKPSFHELI